MKLSDTDSREFCNLHGWVGRHAFQHDRHDLCEAPADPLTDEDGNVVDDVDDEDVEVAVAEVEEKPPRRGRRRRKRGVPPKKTVPARRITQFDLKAGRAELVALGADAPYDRPQTRNDCQKCPVCQLVRDGDGTSVLHAGRLSCGHRVADVIFHSRPCLFVACQKNLFLDVSEIGSLILNFPHLEPHQMPADQSCSLDLADRGGMTLEEIAEVTNLTRERIRQVELKALLRRARPAAIELGLGAEDAAEVGTRHHVGPGQDLSETGVDGEVPGDVSSILLTRRD